MCSNLPKRNPTILHHSMQTRLELLYTCSTSYHGELQAINLAITELLEVMTPINRLIHLLSDCQSTNVFLNDCWLRTR